MDEMRFTDRRGLQLDAIATLLLVAMGVVVALLLYLLSAYGVELPESAPLATYIERVLLGGFVLVVIAYLWDQRARLRQQVNRAMADAEQARAGLERTCEYLAFSHDAASRLGAQGVDEALGLVLRDASELFKADAAAVLGEDEESMFVAEGVPGQEAERALAHAAAYAAGKGTPIHVESLGAEEGQAIAVPLRVRNDLRYVMVLWKRTETFQPDQLDALGLMGRMVELALEREDFLKEAQDQLEGTLGVLQYLVVDQRPDYSRHAVDVAELAFSIAGKMGLPVRVRKELRLAGLVHDVGMMNLRGEVGDAGHVLTEEEWAAVRQHSKIGSEIAKAANFDQIVQDAIAGHHERMDGSGYPLGSSGTHIPVEARILAVCEIYDSMTHRSYHGVNDLAEDAMVELTRGAGKLYDADAVRSLSEVLEEVRSRK